MARGMAAWLRGAFQSPRKSIRFKLVSFFLIVAIIPLLSLGFLSYRTSSDLLHVQFGKFGQNAVGQLQSQLDAQLKQMALTASYIHSYLLDPAKSVITEEIPKSYSQIQEKNNLEDFLKALKTEAHAGIFIVTQSGYYYGENALQTRELERESWWNDIPPSHRGPYWAGLYEPRHYSKSHGNPANRLLGLVVPIRNQEGPLRDSRILVEMKADGIYRQLEAFERDMNANLTIRDAGGRAIYESGTDYAPRENDVIWTKRLQENNWTIEARVPYEQFYQSSTVIRFYTYIGIGLSALLALLLAFLLSSRFTFRIKRLKESMNKAGTGRLGTRIDVDSDDELGVLGRSFNNMLGQIQSLVDEVTLTEQLKKEAELRAIHYQINPHLLFNTLNSIQWKARLQGNEEIRQMLYHLTMVLEGSLDIRQELVTVERELAMIDHFLHIQRIRYGDVFRYESDVDGSALGCLIPRMSLQPLFENIFFHAFEDGEGAIALQLREEGGLLVLTLSDNGTGMAEERRRTVLDPGAKRIGRGGLGVGNVDQKFKLHFGPAYGLSIESAAGEGTTITIVWPKKGAESDERID
ncbi:sensor histidine kinase [Paenibacillus sp. LHD-117]|uniref:sensor histidine kinase n=1 Tax=Paenibacillus sp. LHD-117 TaxID=3071412 RepID=UPI0027DFB87E|nr:sensor histidine kinase [Paenibacillus sp. LHD-117]MDQ6419775.1 sensor histidine kinase [Paenibacillus sp. LHD-117]